MAEVSGNGVPPAVMDRISALEGGTAGRLGNITTIYSLSGANLNSTADQQLTKLFNFTRFIIREILVTNASGAILLATGGIYTDVSKGGSAVVSAAQSWTGLTSTTKVITLALTTAGGALMTTTNLYLSLTTPQGSAGTADVYVMGIAG